MIACMWNGSDGPACGECPPCMADRLVTAIIEVAFPESIEELKVKSYRIDWYLPATHAPVEIPSVVLDAVRLGLR